MNWRTAIGMMLVVLAAFAAGAAFGKSMHGRYVGEGAYSVERGNGIHYRCMASGAEEFPAGLPANANLRPGLCDGSALRAFRGTASDF